MHRLRKRERERERERVNVPESLTPPVSPSPVVIMSPENLVFSWKEMWS
jgi:hypothetical protein